MGQNLWPQLWRPLLALASKYFLLRRTHMLRCLFTLARWAPDTASTLRVAAHMQDALSLSFDDALVHARKHSAMLLVCKFLAYLYAYWPADAISHVAAQYRFDIRGKQAGLVPPGGHLIAFMHTWDYWFGVRGLMIEAGPSRTGTVVRLRLPDAQDDAVAQLMAHAGFSLTFIDGSSRSGLRQLTRALRDGGLVFLFADFYPYDSRATVLRWFGSKARLPSGLLDIAALLKVPITIAETHIDDAFVEWVELTPFVAHSGMAPPPEMQQLATLLEQRIRAMPEQWRCWEGFETYFYAPASSAQRDVIRQIKKRSEQLA